MILAQSAGGFAAQLALLITALGGLLGVILTYLNGRRPPPPPPPHDGHPDPEGLWRELLEQLDAAGEAAERWEAAFHEADAERLELLRRMAGGNAP